MGRPRSVAIAMAVLCVPLMLFLSLNKQPDIVSVAEVMAEVTSVKPDLESKISHMSGTVKLQDGRSVALKFGKPVPRVGDSIPIRVLRDSKEQIRYVMDYDKWNQQWGK